MSILRIALTMMHSTATAAAVIGSSSLDQPLGPDQQGAGFADEKVRITFLNFFLLKVRFFSLIFKTGQNSTFKIVHVTSLTRL
jgi:hypothetical protein